MSRKEVLIVEDEEGLANLQSLLLNSRGYNAKVIADGEVALEIISRKQPDLVFLDIKLPGEIDGIEVCRRIKDNKTTRHIPVVMVSAMKGRDAMNLSVQAGADWYIVKPFKSSEFIEAAQRFLAEEQAAVSRLAVVR